MIILRHKEFSDKLTKTVHTGNKLINSLMPATKKKTSYALRKTSIKTREKMLDKAAGAVSDYVHVDNGKIDGVKSGLKVAGKIIENPVAGSAAVVVPGGGLAFPATSKLEAAIEPKKVREVLSKGARKVDQNEKLSEGVKSTFRKISSIGQNLGLV